MIPTRFQVSAAAATLVLIEEQQERKQHGYAARYHKSRLTEHKDAMHRITRYGTRLQHVSESDLLDAKRIATIYAVQL